ncbi:MAG: DUF4834 family protein [Bacteroidaceae bacterium]|nr:DUF4834 family protein [Bacteroidaceae bacterium]
MGLISFLLIPFIILFVIVVGVIVTFLSGILRFLGLGNRSYSYGRQSASSRDFYGQSASNRSQTNGSTPSQSRKVIGDDEGEYVDFEEVK